MDQARRGLFKVNTWGRGTHLITSKDMANNKTQVNPISREPRGTSGRHEKTSKETKNKKQGLQDVTSSYYLVGSATNKTNTDCNGQFSSDKRIIGTN